MDGISRRDRLRYWFDNTMSRGPAILIIWLGILTILFIAAGALIVRLTGIDDQNLSFLELMWVGLMRTMDPGAVGGDSGRWSYLLIMLAITVGGIFIYSTLISILISGLEARLDTLRKGRSLVAETGHIIILGWSSQIFMVVTELIAAHLPDARTAIVILADEDKVMMEDALQARITLPRNIRLVCRSGSPHDLDDLEIVNPLRARSIIIMSPENNNPDIQVIKTILALMNKSEQTTANYHIVAAIRDQRNMNAAQLAGHGAVQLVPFGDVIARIAAQTSRQSGLPMIYTELLGFSGDEIYFHQEPGLNGRPFGEALLLYEDAVLIGLYKTDGTILFNPPAEAICAADDRLIVIAENKYAIQMSASQPPPVDQAAIVAGTPAQVEANRILLLGWNTKAPTLITELDSYAAPGSEMTVVVADETMVAGLPECLNQTVSYKVGNIADRDTLLALEAHRYDHVIVLSYSETMPIADADAHTLLVLLQLRQINEQYGNCFSIVSEILENRSRALAEVTRADDFIIGDRLVSLILTQLAENKNLGAVFQILFDADGSEFYMKPAGDLVKLGTPVNFYTVSAAAWQQDTIAVGYRLMRYANDPARGYGIKLNPTKSEMVTFQAEDRIVILAEDLT